MTPFGVPRPNLFERAATSPGPVPIRTPKRVWAWHPHPLPVLVLAVATMVGCDRSADEPRSGGALTGIDVLARDGFAQLRGRRVGLITNHTGLSRDGISTARLLYEAPGVELVVLFSPEHGLKGLLDVAKIADARDDETGLRVYSLYGETRQPTPQMLEGIDTLVFDIQDIGTRFYTYISTLGLAMQAAAEHGIRFVVLDRPNTINGIDVEGPILDPGRECFVAWHPLPIRHGMTVGELARMFDAELSLDLGLQVIAVEGWRRADYFDATGLQWVDPSPNMRSLTEAILYPGIGLLEKANLSVGRGTATPFELFGAPWLDAEALATRLDAAALDGVRFEPITFTPDASKFAGELCHGVRVALADRRAFRPVRAGLTIAVELRRLHPDDWDAAALDHLLRHRRALDAVLAGRKVADIEALWEAELSGFLERRAPFLLYD